LRKAFLISGTESAGCGGDYLGVKSLAEVERWLIAQG
jgi:D-glycero-D-manno-heptose 1,7-bisphosphate phosphatase